MEDSQVIQFLKNNEIDKDRWNDCVKLSVNSLIYGRTFYLDNIASGWSAITGLNYEWVLPLTTRQKFGITYLYQPAFTQQLGVFFKPNVAVPYEQIISYLQKHYKFCEVNWNFATSNNLGSLPLQMETANNYILDLSADYEIITANYRNDLVKNIKRSDRFGHIYRSTKDSEKCVDLYKEYYGKRLPHMKENDYKNFSRICAHAAKNDLLVCREVINENETLMASAILLSDGKRLYNLMNTTTSAGRKTQANHFLLNALIQEFSNRNMILDFEGSDLAGVKSFYENFGTINQPYYKLRYNCLPWPVKLFKR